MSICYAMLVTIVYASFLPPYRPSFANRTAAQPARRSALVLDSNPARNRGGDCLGLRLALSGVVIKWILFTKHPRPDVNQTTPEGDDCPG
jgi:hypothetical protein